MAQYRTTVAATTNVGGSSFDTFIELLPPSGVSIALKRIRVGNLDTTVIDDFIRIRVFRLSSAGATGTTGTAIRLNPQSPASVTTVTVKNGTAAFTTGTTLEEFIDATTGTRGIWEWIARDGTDFINSRSNQRLAIVISCGGASQDLTVECDWEE